MSLGFKSDIFSYSKITWKKDIDTKNIDNIKIIINKNISDLKYTIYQSSGMELNSNNFILKFPSKILILKRWNSEMSFLEIKSILNLMTKLNKKKITVPKPKFFNNKRNIIKYKNEFWSYFDFIDGNHFKGNLEEMKNVAKFLGKITGELEKYSINKYHKKYKYFNKQDHNILQFLKKNYLKLNKFFSEEHARQIKDYLPKIIKLFKKLKNYNIEKKQIKLIHMDIHPHNIITKNNFVKALLDIDSCVIGEIGHALAYATLKICKQTVIYNKGNISKKKIKLLFINELKKTYYLDKKIENNFYYFAVSEVLRRLIYMFRLSINNKDTKWNHVIPIQLGHLDECEALFK